MVHDLAVSHYGELPVHPVETHAILPVEMCSASSTAAGLPGTGPPAAEDETITR